MASSANRCLTELHSIACAMMDSLMDGHEKRAAGASLSSLLGGAGDSLRHRGSSRHVNFERCFDPGQMQRVQQILVRRDLGEWVDVLQAHCGLPAPNARA